MTDVQTPPANTPLWERLLPRLGTVGAFFTALCCLGLSAAVSLATALGATFMTRDSTLQPLLLIMLLITITASVFTFRRHRNPLPLALTVLAAALVYFTLYGFGWSGGDDHGGGHAAGARPAAAQQAPLPQAGPVPPMAQPHGDPHAPQDPHAQDPHAPQDPHAQDPHATSDPHAVPSTAAVAPTDSHMTSGPHMTEPHATAPHTDEHATTPHTETGHSGGHGSTTDKTLVWIGLIVLVGAQVWDLLLLRAQRRARMAAAV